MSTGTDVHFDCVFYYVTDLDRAIRFYTDVLGLELVSRAVVARFKIDGVLFELVPAPDEVVIDGAGNARLCLRVGDIQSAKAGLKAKGASVGDTKVVENGILAPFEDPDGNELFLWQYT